MKATATTNRSTQESVSLELSSAGEVETLVRAHSTRFIVTNRTGDIVPPSARELGLFANDTRFLSHYELRIAGMALTHLSSDTFDAAYNRIDLMVGGFDHGEFLDDPQNFLHVRRRQLFDDAFFDEITFINYLQRPIDISVTIAFAADFADVFEVRGAKRPKRGASIPPVVGASSVELAYRGVDETTYATLIEVSPIPSAITPGQFTFHLHLAASGHNAIELHVTPSTSRKRYEQRPPFRSQFDTRAKAERERVEKFLASSTRFHCDNTVIEHVLAQSSLDLHALSVEVGNHKVVAAGIPWFCCPFGRDTLLASYEALLLNAELAPSSLRCLAQFQGKAFNDFTEEEPGKIFHELRFGEMARCGEIPHSPYYGSVDSTLLFIVILDMTYRATGDTALIRELRETLISALGWLDRQSENGTALIYYQRKSPSGLDNQGWKDSKAGVSFPGGARADAPIALCEVQGYGADAYVRGAHLLAVLGEETLAARYLERAASFRAHMEERFWLPQEQRYAYAIDGKHRALPTVVSNLGHLLWSNVVTPERARPMANLLMSSASLSAFGIRTLAAEQPVYNPLSYHNGTVWPHDNAIIAQGMANYGFMDEAATIFEAMIGAMYHFRDRRLPELFCGMSRSTENLVRYPVACSPQAWAAAAPFLLLQACLGITIDAAQAQITIRNPRLPRFLRRMEIEGLRVGASSISIRFRRVGHRCHVDRLDVTGRPLRTVVEMD